MILGIMQPYFFPYIGYWQMFKAVDKYLIYDDVNYIKGGWINRNRILIDGKAHYINLPTIHASPNKLICDIDLSGELSKREKILSTIKMSYSRAPFFDDTISLLHEIVLFVVSNLAKFLEHSIRSICNHLSINTDILVSSALAKDNTLRGTERLLNICEILHADTYYNAIGGQSLYDKSEFNARGLALRFLKTHDICYKQFKNEFIPNLSIIDVLMFNSRDDVIGMLDLFSLI